MTPISRAAWLLALALAIAACKGEPEPQQGGTAAGEVLPGSASDAMLPYDTVRSQPPLAPPPAATGQPGARASGDGEEDAATQASEAPGAATPESGATPTPSAPAAP